MPIGGLTTSLEAGRCMPRSRRNTYHTLVPIRKNMPVCYNGNKRISRLNPSSWKILKNSWPWVIPHEKMLRIEIERAYKSFTFVVLWFGSFINRVNPKIIRAMDWRLINISNGQASQWRRHYVDGQVTYLNTTFYLALVFGVPQKRHLNTKGGSESFFGGSHVLRSYGPSSPSTSPPPNPRHKDGRHDGHGRAHPHVPVHWAAEGGGSVWDFRCC